MKQPRSPWARFLSIALSIAIVCTMLPTTVLAADGVNLSQHDVFMNGQARSSSTKEKQTSPIMLKADASQDNLETKGWKWDAKSKVLTLDGLDLEACFGPDDGADLGGMINFNLTYGTYVTIKLAGNNTIKCIATESNDVGISCPDKLTIENLDDANPGTLNIEATGKTVPYGISGYKGNVEIKGGSVTIIANEEAIQIGKKSIIVSGGSLAATSLTKTAFGNATLSAVDSLSVLAGDSAANASTKTVQEINNGDFKYVQVGAVSTPGPSIAIGAQSAAINHGTAGTANYTVTGKNFGGDNPDFVPELQWKSGENWSTTAPMGIAGTLSGNGDSHIVTVTTTATVNAGDYEFKVVSGDAVSAVAKVKVDRIEYPNKTQNYNVKSDIANSAATFVLPEIAGAAYGAVTVTTDVYSLISGTPEVSGTTLNMNVTSQADGSTAVLTIPVTGATNYNDFTMTVNITARDKSAATITAAIANKSYDGIAVELPVPTAVEQDTMTPVTLEYTYRWQANTGTESSPIWSDLSQAPQDAGNYKLIIEGSNDTHMGTTEVTFSINKATVTITANNKSAYVGDIAPVLEASDYTVTGLVYDESLATAPTIAYASTPDMTKAGSVAIKVSGAAVPTGGNYEDTITYTDGTLTISQKSSGGGSSGGYISTPTVTEPATGSVHVTATTDKDGTATFSITDKLIADAVQAAKDEATKKGVQAGEITAIIHVATEGKDVAAVAVNLAKEVQQQILNSKIVKVVLVIDKTSLTLGMDLEMIKEMNKQADGDLQLVIDRIDATKLSGKVRHIVGIRPAFELSITFADGAKHMTTFGNGKVDVSFPYAMHTREVADGVSAVYADQAGKVTTIAGFNYATDTHTLHFLLQQFSIFGVGYQALVDFADVSSHWSAQDAECIMNRGIMDGISNTQFAPNETMTRAMFMMALARMADADVSSYTTSTFSDVDKDASYAPYVNWAAGNRIVNGVSATSFAPDQYITRQEMAVILNQFNKVMGYQVPDAHPTFTFEDQASIAIWAADDIQELQVAGVVIGTEGSRYNPARAATRAEIAAMLHRYVEIVIEADHK